MYVKVTLIKGGVIYIDFGECSTMAELRKWLNTSVAPFITVNDEKIINTQHIVKIESSWYGKSSQRKDE